MTASISNLPMKPEEVANNPRMEWLFACLEGMPPARQKRLIIQARSPEVGFIDDSDAGLVLDALGLRGE